MAEVLYGDYKFNTSPLAKKLRQEGIEVDCIDNKKEKGILRLANEIFWEKYYGRLRDYKVLIAHLSVTFDGNVKHLLEQNPKLSIVLVSKLPSHYSNSGERCLICGYKSNRLIPFVQEALKN